MDRIEGKAFGRRKGNCLSLSDVNALGAHAHWDQRVKYEYL